jgi:predicted TIM-barrel fold metal-dependent hydrolase
MIEHYYDIHCHYFRAEQVALKETVDKYKLFNNGLISSKEHFRTEENKFKRSNFPNKPLVVTPLMMDTDFLDYDGADGMTCNPGGEVHFDSQLEEIRELHESFPKQVFPFLAVDPRREKLMTLVEQHIHTKDNPKGTFWGIKVYPPLGYLPTHPLLEPVYDFCLKYDIPVTTHCASTGYNTPLKKVYIYSWTFHPPDKGQKKEFTEGREQDEVDYFWIRETPQSLFFADPQNWLPVLKKYPHLRLNFAHLGGRPEIVKFDNKPEPKKNWTQTIVDIIKSKQYPNVYTDVSAVVKEKGSDNPVTVVKKLLETELPMAERLMFGTDFWLTKAMLWNLKHYFDEYYKTLSEEQIEKACYSVPKNFLKGLPTR